MPVPVECSWNIPGLCEPIIIIPGIFTMPRPLLVCVSQMSSMKLFDFGSGANGKYNILGEAEHLTNWPINNNSSSGSSRY